MQVRSLTKDYDDGVKRVTVLKDISFDMGRNEFVAIVGPSGCGKSTLLRLLSGLDRPTKGDVLYDGKPVQPDNPKVTMVFQNFALLPWLDVLDNVALGLEALGVARAPRHAKAQDLIDTVGLTGFEQAYPRELSGGMKQRVGLARALATDPILLCMDEPFSNLDTLTSENLREEVLRLWADPTLPPEAVVMVTHSVEEAVYMADRILVLGGRPAQVVADQRVALPRPRDRRSPEFAAATEAVFRLVS